jgi:hypothetical protein
MKRKITACETAHPDHEKWLALVAELENEGIDRSDAQSIADIEFENKQP